MTILYQNNWEAETLSATPPGWGGVFKVYDGNSRITVSGSRAMVAYGEVMGSRGWYKGIAARTAVEYQLKQKAIFNGASLLLQSILHCDDPNNTGIYENGYLPLLESASATAVTINLKRAISTSLDGSPVATQTKSWSVSAGDVIVEKVRIDGTVVSVWVWNETNESEPTTPTLTYTDSTQRPAGYLHVSYNNGNGAVATGFDDVLITDLSAADTTPPSLTSPTATATGPTTASGSVTSNEANGTLYYLASTNATETDVTVRAAASQAVTQSATPQSVSFTGLTAATPYYPHYLHRDAAGNDSAVASGAQFTTDALSGDTDPPTLTGVVTFTSITQTSYTANWPAGSDNVTVTGYEYQIGGTAGAWTDAGNNLSAAITGRTAGMTETVYARAYDAAGLRSTPAISGNVTLLSPPQAVITVSQPLKNNGGAVWANQSGIRVAVLRSADLVSVYETAGLTTNGAGRLSNIADTSIIAGEQYHVVIKFADGGVGITGTVTAS